MELVIRSSENRWGRGLFTKQIESPIPESTILSGAELFTERPADSEQLLFTR